MKKIIIILLLYSMTFFCIAKSHSINSNEFIRSREYDIINNNTSKYPTIIEFFSFFCPYCYEIEKIYHIKNLIKKNFFKNIYLHTYHTNFFGGQFSQELTKSWIIAKKIGAEEKIIIPIFKGIQENHTINDINDIKSIFLKYTKISVNEYNKLWNSFTIYLLVIKNNYIIEKMNIKYVPIMLINSKYSINYYQLELLFKKEFSTKLIKLINFLILKDKK